MFGKGTDMVDKNQCVERESQTVSLRKWFVHPQRDLSPVAIDGFSFPTVVDPDVF